ncbi:DUF342 domain-containing protein [Parablautia muri]|uniref:DUF342 domain-containing protein n=1 Tax=Parablautia muri TaxID=2320879 RepID=A0A9X5GR86_9FIRM|nr:FapA family protein [Parablautia muri]NBJ92963.1 DUF342 domain-containing protein [Parablautia muri]
MGNKHDFFSNDDLMELRREMELLAEANDDLSAAKEKQMPEETKEQAKSLDAVEGEETEEEKEAPLGIEKNGSYIRISQDNMTAWMYLTVPGEGKDNYTMEEFDQFLKKKGIVTGYHHSNLAAMIKKRVYEREIIVAQGQPAVEGKDGYYEYKFDPDQNKAPKVLEDGRVDYTTMSTLQNVRKGDVVAIYHHAKEGKDGYNIKGKSFKARKVKEATPLTGSDIYTEGDPDVYLAQKSGKIELKKGKIDIQAVHEIKGDLTLITGKVEFYGDIVVTGNVEAGVTIRAGRNIEIKGTVEAVNLFAGGNIILSRGIQGAQRAKVSAKGDIFADFIEHTLMMAGGNVQANSIINSKIVADGEVVLTGARGTIIGGYTHGMLGIQATEIGNSVEVKTVVHAGCEKEIYQKMYAAKSKELSLSEEVKEASDEYKELCKKKQLGKIPQRLETQLQYLEGRLRTLKEEMGENNKVLEEMESLVVRGKDAKIMVKGNIYRGTVVSLAQAQMPIEDTTCLMKYYHQNGIIESSVIAYS